MSTPISGFTPLGGPPAADDLIPLVDVSDHTQASTGTTKNMTPANLFTNPTFPTNITVTGTATVGALVTGTVAASSTITAVGTITSTSAFGWTIGSVSNVPRITFGGAAANAYALITGANAFADLYLSAIVATGAVTAANFVGPLTGNASTATKWAAPILINGQSVDGSVNVTIPLGNTLKEMTADVAEAAGVSTSLGLTQAIGIGESWHLRWVLALSSDGNSNGAGITVTLPTASKILAVQQYNNTGPTNIAMAGMLGSAGLSAVGQYDSSVNGTYACIIIDVEIVAASSATTADLKFSRLVGGTQTMKAGGSLLATLKA